MTDKTTPTPDASLVERGFNDAPDQKALFEKFIRHEYGQKANLRPYVVEGMYVDDEIDLMWKGWKASVAAQFRGHVEKLITEVADTQQLHEDMRVAVEALQYYANEDYSHETNSGKARATLARLAPYIGSVS